MGSNTAFPLTLGGVAVVVCVHDREKRQVRNPDDCLRLAEEFGIEFDPAQHKFFMCACCDNCFASTDDTPKFCHACEGSLVHGLGGPLPEPTEAIE